MLEQSIFIIDVSSKTNFFHVHGRSMFQDYSKKKYEKCQFLTDFNQIIKIASLMTSYPARDCK